MKTEKSDIDTKEERPPARYDLEEMLESINDENLHDEFDLGKAVGKEVIDYEI